MVWGVSRTNTIVNVGQGEYNTWSAAQLSGCGNTKTVTPPNDVIICNGRVYEAVQDSGGQSTLAMYPKQPFDIAGRTGTVVFDVSADSDGPHDAWPEFWWTDQPVPAPRGHSPASFTFARNSFGFSLASDQCAAGETSVYEMFVTRNYQYDVLPFTLVDCVRKGTAGGNLNHFEVRINQNRVEVWGTDAGATTAQAARRTVTTPTSR